MEVKTARKELEILQYPHPYLETESEPIDFLSRDLILLSQNMVHTMEAANGIGLSANQIGVLKRMFVMKIISNNQEDPQYLIAINPLIIENTEEMDSLEGCLSFNYIESLVPVKRSNKIVMSYSDLNGEYKAVELTGINAICAQHEIDHLNGITFVDRTTEEKRTELIELASINLFGDENGTETND
tara:strand:- start:2591 stop:3148 length:558 start_codon:yes stop_codon:yes gene_type:complete